MTEQRVVAPDDLDGVRERISDACRILANAGIAEDILGHVSARVDYDHMAIRCRGPLESGLLFTESTDIHLVGIDDAQPPTGRYSLPNEYPIHAEIYKARPDVNAIVHAHPPAVVAANLANHEFKPIVGAYNIPAMRMAEAGIPIYERSVLINTDALGTEVVTALGDSSVCILRGHGIVAVGDSVEQATVRALNLNTLARMTLMVASLGSTPVSVPLADMALMPDLGNGFNDQLVWRNHIAKLRAGRPA